MKANPYGSVWDILSPELKIFWKSKIAPLVGYPHHSEIIPETKNHYAWYLGAQPDNAIIKLLLKTFPSYNIHLVNMLVDHERLIGDDSPWVREGKIIFHRLPWYDHSYLDALTTKNQAVDSLVAFQRDLYALFSKRKENNAHSKRVFYCHCMAGRSRSLVETLVFLYFYPSKEELFDFDFWSPETLPPQDLRERLRSNPTFGDLAKFIKMRRRQARNLDNLDGDQGGIIGLLALWNCARWENGFAMNYYDQWPEIKMVEDVKYILRAPLDRGFRTECDGEAQRINLEIAFDKFQKKGINLLLAMVSIFTDHQRAGDKFDINFSKLNPREQAHLAIFMQWLQSQGRDLVPIKYEALHYAKIALSKIHGLTTGDQVELLKIFGREVAETIDCSKVARKILRGNRLDSHNCSIQLAELTSVLLHSLE